MDPILLKPGCGGAGLCHQRILGKFLVPALRRWKAGQSIKEDGPTWHMSKQGTPTMGGLMFIAAVVVVVLVLNGPAILAGDLTSVFVLLLALVFGLIGFVDDYAKIKKKENTGLTASQKFLLQLVAAILFMANSLIMSIIWVILQSPDLAITEAAVGAGVTGILLFITLYKVDGLRGGRQ